MTFPNGFGDTQVVRSAGCEYINIDEGWWKGARDAAGCVTVDANQWHGGMEAIADGMTARAGPTSDGACARLDLP
ncbi:hypothetical protein [Streptomyces sp. NPDC041003]|uniref:hypothetical protein n=1 Tax=Streptomyces sp. NPDC041003 TaxID=3155730 RepID=UPI0033D5649F